MKYILVETTFENFEDAVRLSELLQINKLVADGQISEITSIFNFEGRHYSRKEWLLTSKTQEDLYKQTEEFIKKYHPFKVPQIIAVPIVKSSKEYLAWVDKNLKK